MLDTNWRAPAFAVVVTVAYAIWLLFFLSYSHAFMDLENGLLVCRGNCNSFVMLSEYLLEFGQYATPVTAPLGDVDKPLKAAFPFYRGFVTMLALLKLMFGDYWPIGYVISNGALVALNGVVVAKLLAPRGQRLMVYVSVIILSALSVRLAIYSKFVLTDFSFAQISLLAFVLLAGGIKNKSSMLLVSALLIALLSASFKIQGVLVTALVLAGICGWLIGRILKVPVITVATPAIAGLIGCIGAIIISAWAAQNIDTIRSMPDSLTKYTEILLEINVYGEDYIATGPNPTQFALGGQVYVSPSGRERIYGSKDSSVIGILGTAALRAQYMPIEMIFGYTRSCAHFRGFCQIYRPVVQISMFVLLFISIVYVLKNWRRSPGLAVLVSCMAGYFFLFLGVSLVIMRYLIPFEAFSIVIGSLILARLPAAFKLISGKTHMFSR